MEGKGGSPRLEDRRRAKSLIKRSSASRLACNPSERIETVKSVLYNYYRDICRLLVAPSGLLRKCKRSQPRIRRY